MKNAGTDWKTKETITMNNQEILYSKTVQNAIECYASIQEGYVGGEDLPEWDELEDSEQERLVNACRRELILDPGANLMEVMEQQVKFAWFSRGSPTDRPGSSSASGPQPRCVGLSPLR